MRIAVVGTGYVGLVTGAGFAESATPSPASTSIAHGFDRLRAATFRSTSQDSRSSCVAIARSGGSPSPDVDRRSGRARTYRVHRGGNAGARRWAADLSCVLAAAREIAQALDGFTVVVNKSTVPVGTADRV